MMKADGKLDDNYAASQADKLARNRTARVRSRHNTLAMRHKMTGEDKKHMASTLLMLAKDGGLSLRDCGTLDFCRRVERSGHDHNS